jgi:hypothetical protein
MSRRDVVVVVALALALVAGVANATPIVRVDGHDFRPVWPQPTLVNGHLLWGLQPLINEIGGEVSTEGEWITVVRGKDTLKFRVGMRDWEVNGNERQFSIAPMMQDGYLMVPVRDIVRAVGGEYKWDSATEIADVTVHGRYVKMGPRTIYLETPRNGEYIGAGALEARGRTAPDSDVRVTFYRLGVKKDGKPVRAKMDEQTVHSDNAGEFTATFAIKDSSCYRLVAELLDAAHKPVAECSRSACLMAPEPTTPPTGGNTQGALPRDGVRLAFAGSSLLLDSTVALGAERGERGGRGGERGGYRGGGERGERGGFRGGGDFRPRYRGEGGEFRGFWPQRRWGEGEEEEEEENFPLIIPWGSPDSYPYAYPYNYPYTYPYGYPYYYYPPNGLQLTIPFH